MALTRQCIKAHQASSFRWFHADPQLKRRHHQKRKHDRHDKYPNILSSLWGRVDRLVRIMWTTIDGEVYGVVEAICVCDSQQCLHQCVASLSFSPPIFLRWEYSVRMTISPLLLGFTHQISYLDWTGSKLTCGSGYISFLALNTVGSFTTIGSPSYFLSLSSFRISAIVRRNSFIIVQNVLCTWNLVIVSSLVNPIIATLSPVVKYESAGWGLICDLQPGVHSSILSALSYSYNAKLPRCGAWWRKGKQYYAYIGQVMSKIHESLRLSHLLSLKLYIV